MPVINTTPLALSPEDEARRLKMAAQYAWTMGMDKWCKVDFDLPESFTGDDEEFDEDRESERGVAFLIQRIKDIEALPGNAPLLRETVGMDDDCDVKPPMHGQRFTVLRVLDETDCNGYWDAGVIFEIRLEDGRVVRLDAENVMTWECFLGSILVA